MTILGARPRREPSLTVGCPHCSNRYLLPKRLMGPGGARVRCPGCEASFDVPPEAPRPAEARRVPPHRVVGTEDRAEPEPARAAGEPRSERAIAHAVVEGLASHAAAMLEAHARGRLFAETGPLLLDAFDAYRLQAGAHARAETFREALGRRWGITLPAAPPGASSGP